MSNDGKAGVATRGDQRVGKRSVRVAVAATIGCVAAMLSSCGRNRPSDSTVEAKRNPVVIIGADGLEWSVLGPMLAAGELPNLRGLVERGTSGYLYTITPTLSPTIWTCVATGRRPEEHGIQHFLDATGNPYTSGQRRVRALWNIASRYDREVLSVGWWVTWPAEEVKGRIVAPVSAAGQNQMVWKGNLHPPSELPNQTWPRELIDEVYPIAAELAQEDYLAERRAMLFGDVSIELEETETEHVERTLWADVADESFLRVAKYLLDASSSVPDLTMVYFGATDVASHRFWGYRHPDQFEFSLPTGAVNRLSTVIDTFYKELDRRVGELLASLPADVNVVVCSDHGFRPFFTEQPSPLGISGHHIEGPGGVVIVAGPAVNRGKGNGVLHGETPIDAGRMYEVAPLLLTLLGVPSSREFVVPDGGALARNALDPTWLAKHLPPALADSHDDGFAATEIWTPPPRAAIKAMREWMGQLGYMEGVGAEPMFAEVLPKR